MQNNIRIRLLQVLVTLLFWVSAPYQPKVQAQELDFELLEYKQAKQKDYGIIQERKFSIKNELVLKGVWIPGDPYNQPIVGELGFTHFFNNHVGWNILSAKGFFYINALERDFRRAIVQEITQKAGSNPPDPDADPSQLVFPEIQQVFTSRLIIKPVYGKFSWLNRKNLRMETQFEIGPALLRIARVSNENGFDQFETLETKTSLGGELGVSFRFWMGKNWSMLLGIHDLIYLGPEIGAVGKNKLQHAPFINVGVSISSKRKSKFGGR